MKAVVLAAGKGSRLYPVTKVIPKPLLPLANRITLAYAFDQLKECGIREICIVVGENEPLMKETLGDGSEFGVSLSYVRQLEPKGLAHAVGFAEEFVGDDDFVLYLGDAIYGGSLKPAVDMFVREGAANVNLVKPVEDPRRFGVANVDAGGRITKLVEKPAEPESNLAMAGMYVFGPELWPILPELQPSGRGEYEITDAIQMLVDKGEKVFACQYDDTWFDTGTLDSFLGTSRFLSGSGQLVAEGAVVEAELGDHVVVGDGALVSSNSVEDSVILPGANVKVSGVIRGSVLGGDIEVDGDLVDAIRYGDVE